MAGDSLGFGDTAISRCESAVSCAATVVDISRCGVVGMMLSALLSLHVRMRPSLEGTRGQGEHTAPGGGGGGAGAIRVLPGGHRSAIIWVSDPHEYRGYS